MTEIAEILSDLAVLADEVGLLPDQVEGIIGLRSMRWPLPLPLVGRWRPTAAQSERARLLREVCAGIVSLMGDDARDWLDDWVRRGPAGSRPIGADRRDLADLCAELRRECGLG